MCAVPCSHAIVALGAAGHSIMLSGASSASRCFIAVHARVVVHPALVALYSAKSHFRFVDDYESSEETDSTLVFDEEVLVSRQRFFYYYRYHCCNCCCFSLLLLRCCWPLLMLSLAPLVGDCTAVAVAIVV